MALRTARVKINTRVKKRDIKIAGDVEMPASQKVSNVFINTLLRFFCHSSNSFLDRSWTRSTFLSLKSTGMLRVSSNSPRCSIRLFSEQQSVTWCHFKPSSLVVESNAFEPSRNPSQLKASLAKMAPSSLSLLATAMSMPHDAASTFLSQVAHYQSHQLFKL